MKITFSKLVLSCNLTNVMFNNKKQPFKKKNLVIAYTLTLEKNVNIMPGHPTQSGHITSSTAKWWLGANRKGTDKHNM